MQSVGERIKIVRDYKNKMSQNGFAQKLGTTAAAISRYESNLRAIPSSIIISISREFGISREWLETGEGEMLVQTNTQTLDRIAQRYSRSKTFRAMLDVYTEMDEEGQAAVERYVELLSEAVAKGEDPAEVDVDKAAVSISNIISTAEDGKTAKADL